MTKMKKELKKIRGKIDSLLKKLAREATGKLYIEYKKTT